MLLCCFSFKFNNALITKHVTFLLFHFNDVFGLKFRSCFILKHIHILHHTMGETIVWSACFYMDLFYLKQSFFYLLLTTACYLIMCLVQSQS